MRIGIALPNYGPLAGGDNLLRLALAAERFGADSVWVSDHVAIPATHGSVYPYDRSSQPAPAKLRHLENCFDALGTLAFLAGATRRIRLGVSVYIMPLRNPVLTAKTVATLDQLSGGRVIFGCGVGWLQEEFELLQAPPFAARGTVTDDFLRVARAVWQSERVELTGKYTAASFHAGPKPLQQPLPVWIGGNSRAAIRRAARLGNGWHPIDLAPADLAAGVRYLRQTCAEAGRDPAAVTVSLRHLVHAVDSNVADQPRLSGPLDKLRADLHDLRAAGLEYLVISLRHGSSIESMLEQVERLAPLWAAGS